ncbi:MAG: hypothetical protein CBD88_07215 [Flavobacteriales bacterium TMED228]|nr:MAG: hypothetical protein CBD88_07215 [Flavobacteriales bacterium TMED228]|tara:strand:- start:217 stop:516 length:300 start_codon:yes stop_codon:yes gene_type:complete
MSEINLDELDPHKLGMSLAETMRAEGVNQYELAEMFNVSQGAIQKMLAAEQKKSDDEKKRNFIVYEDATKEPRIFIMMEWKVIHVGKDIWQVSKHKASR